MAQTETVTTRETRRATTTQTAHIRSYKAMGVFLGIGLALVTLIATALIFYFDTPGANRQLNTAFYGLVIICALLTLGLFYVLFTLRATLRMVRQQAADIATLREIRHDAGAARYQPAATVAYHPSSLVTQSEPATSSRNVIIIEGIGPVFTERLERNGIRTLADLRAADVEYVAKAAEAPLVVAQKWRAMADLMVVPEVDKQAAEILIHCDINTVDQLSQASIDPLFRKAAKANVAHELRVSPENLTKPRVAAWVQGARSFAASG